MVPKIHSTGGHSFKGCINYLLYGQHLRAGERDCATKLDERVAWTMTGNLGTNNPATAARVMAATSKNAERLKAAEGVSNRGRGRSAGDVMHYTLSWRADEIPGLTKEGMQQAALDSLKALGKDTANGKRVPKDGGRRQFASEHQYVVVCHREKEHPHVHIVVCMTHPTTGRRLPTSNDRNKLSTWARKYQAQHNNQHLCPAREENFRARRWNERRRRFDRYVKADRPLSRQEWNLQQSVRYTRVKDALHDRFRLKAAAIAQRGRQQKRDQAKELTALEKSHRQRQQSVRGKATSDWQSTKRQIIAAANCKLKELAGERDADTRDFVKREQSYYGRVLNMWNAINQKGWRVLDKRRDQRKLATVFRTIFHYHANPSARFVPVRERHDKLESNHHRQVDRQLADAKDAIRRKRDAELQAGRADFQKGRETMLAKHLQERAAIKSEWRLFSVERRTAWILLRERYPLRPVPANQPAKTDSAQLLPQPGSQDAARLIDQHKQLLKERLADKQNNRRPRTDGGQGRHQ